MELLLSKQQSTGGGAKSRVWCQIIADVLNIPIIKLQHEQGAALGAAILSMVGTGVYQTCELVKTHIDKVKETIKPNKEKVTFYNKKYQKFRKLYPLLKPFFSGE